MRPPIVHLTFAYGAGLWVGLVLSVPRPLSLAVGAAALAAAGVSGWGGVVGGAMGVGLLTGSLAREREAGSCSALWTPSPPRSVMVQLHDRVGTRGLATATVLASPDGCGG